MTRFLFVLLCSFAFTKSNAQSRQTVDYYTLEQFQERVRQQNDTLYVVNFWATWCGPCVKELPHFKALSKAYADKPIKFILMSLDAQNNLAQTNTFLIKKKIDIEAHLFVGGDPNVWINQLEPSWQGSIPATFLYQNGSKISFKESNFPTQKDLESFIKNRR